MRRNGGAFTRCFLCGEYIEMIQDTIRTFLLYIEYGFSLRVQWHEIAEGYDAIGILVLFLDAVQIYLRLVLTDLLRCTLSRDSGVRRQRLALELLLVLDLGWLLPFPPFAFKSFELVIVAVRSKIGLPSFAGSAMLRVSWSHAPWHKSHLIECRTFCRVYTMGRGLHGLDESQGRQFLAIIYRRRRGVSIIATFESMAKKAPAPRLVLHLTQRSNEWESV